MRKKQKPIHKESWPADVCSTHEEYQDWNRVMHQYKIEYYIGTPTISDSLYDLIERMLSWVEEKHPEWIMPESVTQFVGYKINESN